MFSNKTWLTPADVEKVRLEKLSKRIKMILEDIRSNLLMGSMRLYWDMDNEIAVEINATLNKHGWKLKKDVSYEDGQEYISWEVVPLHSVTREEPPF